MSIDRVSATPVINSDLDGTLVEKPNSRWQAMTKADLWPRDGIYDFLRAAHRAGLGKGDILTARPLYLPPPFSREHATADTHEIFFKNYFLGAKVCGRLFRPDEGIKAQWVFKAADRNAGSVTAHLDDRAKIVSALVRTSEDEFGRRKLLENYVESGNMGAVSDFTRHIVVGVAPQENQDSVVEEMRSVAMDAARHDEMSVDLDPSMIHIINLGLAIYPYKIPEYSGSTGTDFAEHVFSIKSAVAQARANR